MRRLLRSYVTRSIRKATRPVRSSGFSMLPCPSSAATSFRCGVGGLMPDKPDNPDRQALRRMFTSLRSVGTRCCDDDGESWPGTAGRSLDSLETRPSWDRVPIGIPICRPMSDRDRNSTVIVKIINVQSGSITLVWRKFSLSAPMLLPSICRTRSRIFPMKPIAPAFPSLCSGRKDWTALIAFSTR